MDSQTQQGYLVLADISGYTAYLAGVELDHAHEVLTDLLETIVAGFKPLLTFLKLEGDAVFAYAPEASVPRGETLLELLEATYVAFRDRVEAVRRRTTCECSACRAITSLELKLLGHHGDYIVQRVSGVSELVGSDVNLIHRLLKNHVSQATGWRAYALFTEKCLERMKLQPDALRMHAQTEAYEHLGEVQTYSLDLHARYGELCEARRVRLTAEEADVLLTHDLAAPAPIVWEWLNDPRKRSLWMHGRSWSAGFRPGGRTGVGARNHCVHGKNAIVETILDWRPFDYVTSQQVVGNAVMTETVSLEPAPGGNGTRVRNYLKMPAPLPRWLRRWLVHFVVVRVARYKSADQYASLARLMAEAEPAP